LFLIRIRVYVILKKFSKHSYEKFNVSFALDFKAVNVLARTFFNKGSKHIQIEIDLPMPMLLPAPPFVDQRMRYNKIEIVSNAAS